MGSFSLGRVIVRTLTMIRDGMGSVGVFLLLTGSLGQGITWLIQEKWDAETQVLGESAWGLFTSPWYWLMLFFSTVIGAISYGGATAGYLGHGRNRPFSFRDCGSVGLKSLLPMFGLSIIWWFGILVGMIMLIVPGIFVLVFWSLSGPALVDQRLGVIESLRRSCELTQGSRTQIFVALVTTITVLIAPPLLLGFGVSSMSSTTKADFAAYPDEILDPAITLLAIGYNWVTATLLSALAVAIYLEVLAIKGSPVDHSLPAVFE